MARTQAKILSAIWTDPDWLALSSSAQRVYLLLISQPKLTLVGSLDWMPQRWARLSADADLGAVTDGLHELVESTHIVAHDDELVVRKFVAHDFGSAKTVNRNLVKGMWSAWDALSSPLLQKVVVDNLPSDLLTGGPERALERASEPALRLPLERASEPICSLNPEPCSLNPADVPTQASGLLTTGTAAPALDVEQATNRAVGMLANLRAIGGDNPGALAAHIGRTLPDHERAELAELIAAGMEPADAAAALADPLRGLQAVPGGRHDPAAVQSAADRAKRAEEATRARLDASTVHAPTRPPAGLRGALNGATA